jgi:hypothetical protein
MKSHVLSFALLSAIAIVAGAPAQAQNGSLIRSFVSSTGIDSNPCTITQPCQSFAVAYTKISANGIIAALDPGKYGPLTITGPVTVNGNGWAALTAPANSNGITVNAGGSDLVRLSGLEIDGAGAGNFGVYVNSAGKLDIIDSKIEDFSSTGANGLYVPPTADVGHVTITNTYVSNNYVGLGLSGNQQRLFVTMDHVTVTGSTSQYGGVAVNAANLGLYLTISNSIFTDNNVGIESGGGNLVLLYLSNLVFGGNYNSMFLTGTSQLYLSRVVSMANGVDLQISGSNNFVNSDGTNLISSVNPPTTPSQWSNF